MKHIFKNPRGTQNSIYAEFFLSEKKPKKIKMMKGLKATVLVEILITSGQYRHNGLPVSLPATSLFFIPTHHPHCSQAGF